MFEADDHTNRTCAIECTDDEYLDLHSKECMSCSDEIEGCYACQADNQNQVTCIECDTALYLSFNDDMCLPCPHGKYWHEGDEECRWCSDEVENCDYCDVIEGEFTC